MEQTFPFCISSHSYPLADFIAVICLMVSPPWDGVIPGRATGVLLLTSVSSVGYKECARSLAVAGSNETVNV